MRRSDSGAHTAQQQGSSSRNRSRSRRRQETQCTGEADLAGDAVPQRCRERWNPTMEMAKGQAGGGRRDERWTAACRSQHRLGEPASQAVEKGEGRACINYCISACVRTNTSACDGRRAPVFVAYK